MPTPLKCSRDMEPHAQLGLDSSLTVWFSILDFRNCKAATEIVNANMLFSYSNPMSMDMKCGTPKPEGDSSQKQQAEDAGVQGTGTYVVGGSAFGWNHNIHQRNTYYGRSSPSDLQMLGTKFPSPMFTLYFWD
ncbi:hypothetical protein HAX54_048066 [Datura stramonium]|uniref:Uncharacterized protein n=1 Tax=Datura stramonium TaxID=4076 RepID=A0ABS8RQ97_DATST|nr:hypothetical protein [Datura stramonium]